MRVALLALVSLVLASATAISSGTSVAADSLSHHGHHSVSSSSSSVSGTVSELLNEIREIESELTQSTSTRHHGRKHHKRSHQVEEEEEFEQEPEQEEEEEETQVDEANADDADVAKPARKPAAKQAVKAAKSSGKAQSTGKAAGKHAPKVGGRRLPKSSGPSVGSTCLPQDDADQAARAAAVAVRHDGFVYGPSLIGAASFFPNGTLGNARVAADMALWGIDREIIDKAVGADAVAVGGAIMKNGGLKTVADYANVLYNNQWLNANPIGPAPGILTNYTSDLLFSMERLSQNSFPLELVKPSASIPFTVDDSLVKKIAGASLAQLHSKGSLYVVDHSVQAKYPKTTVAPPRYGAACTALFFVHPQSGEFLPLAIKTNTGSNLVYTPLDTANDWMLAKMTFNVNDMFHSQMFHLVVTHDLSEGVHLAAEKTFSEKHPVFAMLDRMMVQGYSSRVVGEQLCFNPGGHWDQLLYINNVGCRQFVADNWPTKGRYQSAYMKTDLKTRGLIDSNGKYKFKTFPYYDDAKIIRQAQEDFFTKFVNAYYPTNADIKADVELNNFFKEVTWGAKVHDFPSIVTKQTLVEALTHFAYIVSVVHHSLNGGDPVGSKATLPFHLPALFAPLPTAKGVTDLMPFLPQPAQAVHYIGFLASFNRPFYRSTNRTLQDAFVGPVLDQFNSATRDAAATFTTSMQSLSKTIQSRKFDSNGLSTNMPFIYRTLDPHYIPFFSCV